jgi:uncharacterized membrane protein (DUF441 family)
MFGLMIGTLALAWGVLVAYLERADAPTGRRIDQLCTALLIGCAVVAITGGVAAAMAHS